MPTVDFSATPAPAGPLSLLPAGEYLVEVSKVNTGHSTKGDEKWGVLFQVKVGPNVGRTVWDDLVFSAAALWRVKHALEALGFDCTHELNIEPGDITGKRVFLTLEHRDGKAKVAKLGYRPIPVHENNAPFEDNPF